MYKKQYKNSEQNSQKTQNYDKKAKVLEETLKETHLHVKQITPWGDINHFFDTKDLDGAVKLLMYLNNRKIRYETNSLLRSILDWTKEM